MTDPAAAFRAPSSLRIRDPGRLHAALRALAVRLTEADLPDPRDRMRLRWWRGFAPELVPEVAFWLPAQVLCGARRYAVSGGVVHEPVDMRGAGAGSSSAGFHLADDVFFRGPTVAGLSRDARVQLRRALLRGVDPAEGLTEADGFPLFEYARVPRRSWELPHEDGEAGLELVGAQLTWGFREAYHSGSTSFPIERVWTAPEGELPVPPPILTEIRELLATAREDPR